MADIIKFKRGKSTTWKTKNLLLLDGEPGFEIDTLRLKIGDGKTKWNDLPYQVQNNENVINARVFAELPSIGQENVIYKVSSTAKLYQWNTTINAYESLMSDGSGSGIPIEDIDIINGGSAYGLDENSYCST